MVREAVYRAGQNIVVREAVYRAGQNIVVRRLYTYSYTGRVKT